MNKDRQAFNPYLPLNEYIPDGEPHVFGDRVYIFGSHDREGGTTYCELDYTVYSAPVTDLTDWRCEGTVYRAEQDPHVCADRSQMYAPDVVRGNDGKYYLYYCLAGQAGKNGFDGPISVAVCDTPAGKYEYLGDVRYPDGRPMTRFIPFDPAVINDNGTIRLYYGWSLPMTPGNGWLGRKITEKLMVNMFHRSPEEIRREPQGIMGANTVELEDDMLTVKGEPVRILPGIDKSRGTEYEGHAFFEASSIRKIGETYYFIYSTEKNHELCYAVSRYPDRDFRYGGVIISNGDIGIGGRKEKRRIAAEKLSEAVCRELRDLGFESVSFRAEFGEREPSPEGTDTVCFMTSLNPGEKERPLQEVASGGELSRIMLALKTVLAETDDIPTLIFDEIDTGISGRTAQKVAEKLDIISGGHQVICITHLPQIAAMADRHFVIQKETREGRNETEIRPLSGEKSLSELTRLLGGARITEAVLQNAREMKELAQKEKKMHKEARKKKDEL